GAGAGDARAARQGGGPLRPRRRGAAARAAGGRGGRGRAVRLHRGVRRGGGGAGAGRVARAGDPDARPVVRRPRGPATAVGHPLGAGPGARDDHLLGRPGRSDHLPPARRAGRGAARAGRPAGDGGGGAPRAAGGGRAGGPARLGRAAARPRHAAHGRGDGGRGRGRRGAGGRRGGGRRLRLRDGAERLAHAAVRRVRQQRVRGGERAVEHRLRRGYGRGRPRARRGGGALRLPGRVRDGGGAAVRRGGRVLVAPRGPVNPTTGPFVAAGWVPPAAPRGVRGRSSQVNVAYRRR